MPESVKRNMVAFMFQSAPGREAGRCWHPTPAASTMN